MLLADLERAVRDALTGGLGLTMDLKAKLDASAAILAGLPIAKAEAVELIRPGLGRKTARRLIADRRAAIGSKLGPVRKANLIFSNDRPEFRGSLNPFSPKDSRETHSCRYWGTRWREIGLPNSFSRGGRITRIPAA